MSLWLRLRRNPLLNDHPQRGRVLIQLMDTSRLPTHDEHDPVQRLLEHVLHLRSLTAYEDDIVQGDQLLALIGHALNQASFRLPQGVFHPLALGDLLFKVTDGGLQLSGALADLLLQAGIQHLQGVFRFLAAGDVARMPSPPPCCGGARQSAPAAWQR